MRSNKIVSNTFKTIFAYAGRGLLLGMLVLGFSAAGCDDDGGGTGSDAAVDAGGDVLKIDTGSKDTSSSSGDTGGDAKPADAANGDANGDVATNG